MAGALYPGGDSDHRARSGGLFHPARLAACKPVAFISQLLTGFGEIHTLTLREPLLLSQTSKWMSPLEQEYVVAHLHRNAPKKTSKTWSTPEIVAMFADPTFWLFSLFWACESGLSHPPKRA
jgi:hypothetical protein